ncbi:MAG: thioredoxin family protein [Betaproteobacteria bacterium]|nr:thioredoxin family protein [Betaproteobacteria bacterium]
MSDSESRIIACLCAAWCRTCDGYREVFDGLQAQFPGDRFVWLDVEDEGVDVLVDTFPTLMVARGRTVQFFGAVLPHADHATRLLRSLEPEAGPSANAKEAEPLFDHLAQ